jgi:hypothetical protein
MAILRLNKEPKVVDDDYFCHADAESSDDAEFIKFRREFYKYQYEFISRAKNANKDLISFYEKLATDEHVKTFYGSSDNGRVLQPRKYNIDLYIDFNLSITKSKEIFDRSTDAIWNDIKEMYDKMSNYNKDYITDYPKNSGGKKSIGVEKRFELWQKALNVYDLNEKSEINKNKTQISNILKLSMDKSARHRIDEVRDSLAYANRLIEAASKGELYEEAVKPMTIGKKRNVVD